MQNKCTDINQILPYIRAAGLLTELSDQILNYEEMRPPQEFLDNKETSVFLTLSFAEGEAIAFSHIDNLKRVFNRRILRNKKSYIATADSKYMIPVDVESILGKKIYTPEMLRDTKHVSEPNVRSVI